MQAEHSLLDLTNKAAEEEPSSPRQDAGATHQHPPVSTTEGAAEFTLRWHFHDAKLAETMTQAWERRRFIDVTLASGPNTIGAHRLVLCACSALLETLLDSPAAQLHPHPILFFHEIDYDDLVALVEFMYRGTMTVTRSTLPGIIRAAQMLKIRGLCRDVDEPVDSPPESSGGGGVSPPAGELFTSNEMPSRKRRKETSDDCEPLALMKKNEQVTDSRPDILCSSPRSPPAASGEADAMNPEQKRLAAFLSALANSANSQLPTKQIQQESATPTGPSPVLRSRLVWDPAHIVYLEKWYLTETRYPSLAQSQVYANQLSQVAHTDQSGKSRAPMSVTAQNVSHWFQNRRRKDNHPEIEEKRVKRGQRRANRTSSGKSTPLDLTQNAPSALQSTPYLMSKMDHPRDSDDEHNSLYIAEQNLTHQSDEENEMNHF